jgi:hypothetical protein
MELEHPRGLADRLGKAGYRRPPLGQLVPTPQEMLQPESKQRVHPDPPVGGRDSRLRCPRLPINSNAVRSVSDACSTVEAAD